MGHHSSRLTLDQKANKLISPNVKLLLQRLKVLTVFLCESMNGERKNAKKIIKRQTGLASELGTGCGLPG